MAQSKEKGEIPNVNIKLVTIDNVNQLLGCNDPLFIDHFALQMLIDDAHREYLQGMSK